jgi:hypothetical protein
MKASKRSQDKAVKIDFEIAKKAEDFISKNENKIKFASLKQFIDIAVLDKLEKEEGIEEKSINIPKPSSNIFPLKKEVKVPSGII